MEKYHIGNPFATASEGRGFARNIDKLGQLRYVTSIGTTRVAPLSPGPSPARGRGAQAPLPLWERGWGEGTRDARCAYDRHQEEGKAPTGEGIARLPCYVTVFQRSQNEIFATCLPLRACIFHCPTWDFAQPTAPQHRKVCAHCR